jgi:hypothetical protein
MDVESILVGALVASAITPTVARLLKKRLDRGELARDGLVDLLTLMSASEELLEVLAAAGPPNGAEDLVGTPSGVSIGDPAFSLQTYLSCFDSEELHRTFIRFFDRQAQLKAISEDTRAAFAWLLATSSVWDSPAGREHLDTLVQGRRALLETVQDHLRFASEICVSLAQIDSPFRAGSTETFIKQHYGLSLEELRVRAAYYRRHRVGIRWRKGDWTCVTFVLDEAACKESFLRLRVDGAHDVVCTVGEEVAILLTASLPHAEIQFLGEEAWRPIPLPARSLEASVHAEPRTIRLVLGPEQPMRERS